MQRKRIKIIYEGLFQNYKLFSKLMMNLICEQVLFKLNCTSEIVSKVNMWLLLCRYIQSRALKCNKTIDKIKHEINQIKQNTKEIDNQILINIQEHSKRKVDDLIKLQKLIVRSKLIMNRIPQPIENLELSTKIVLHSKVKFSETNEIVPSKVRFEETDKSFYTKPSLTRKVTIGQRNKSNDDIKLFRNDSNIYIYIYIYLRKRIQDLSFKVEQRKNKLLKEIIKKSKSSNRDIKF